MARVAAVWKTCNGDAHKQEVGGMMDHCMVCLPYWEIIPTCPADGAKLRDTGYCTVCRKLYAMDAPDGQRGTV